MPRTPRERLQFLALRRALPKLPSVDASEPDPPAPDFILESNGHRLGIELTEFDLVPPPGKRSHWEQQTLKDRIVEEAEILHHKAGGPALYVSIFFREEPSLSKKDTHPFAHELASVVLNCRPPSSFKEPPVEIPWKQLPAGIEGIAVWGGVSGNDRLWDADRGGWVGEASQEQVSKIVQDNAKKAFDARIHCDELWLVIVSSKFSNAAPAEISSQALEANYDAPFDRLLWLIADTPTAIDLRLHSLGA